MMVKAYKSMEFFLLYNNVLALQDILLLIIHGRILTNVVYGHGLRVFVLPLIFAEFLLCGQ
jgi:hypothetical protein